jgi:general secretion pathway protein G
MKSHPRPQKKNRRSAFTLMEVLLVLAILGVIAAMVVPQLMGTQEEAMKDAAAIKIKEIEDAVKRYSVDHKATYPKTLRELTHPEPLEDETTPKPYMDKIKDPWGNDYIYRSPNDQQFLTDGYRPEIYSFGPDGQDNQGEHPKDINNWTARLKEQQNQ